MLKERKLYIKIFKVSLNEDIHCNCNEILLTFTTNFDDS